MRITKDITDFMFISDEPQASDIIFMPGDGNPDIPERAALLYKQGYAPYLLPAGGVSVKLGKFSGVMSKKELYNKDYASDWAFYADVLMHNGVPTEAILREDKSGFTKENALFSRRVTDKQGLQIKKAILCCKSFHARRSLMLYQMAFPKAHIYVVPVDVYGINRETWHRSAYGVKRVFGELQRCGVQLEEDFTLLTAE